MSQTLFDNYQYNIDLIYDSINRQFTGDLNLNFGQIPDSVNQLPFQFLLDSTNENNINVWINNEACGFELKAKGTDEFSGLMVDVCSAENLNDSLNLRIKFKTIKHGDYFNKNQILFNGHWIPMLFYYGNEGFNFNYQKHSDYKVKISYPKDFNIAATGLIIDQNEKEGQARICTEAKDIPSYGLVMSREFLVSDTISRDRIIIRSFYYVNDRKWGKKLLEIAEDVIEFYIDTLGFYPQPILNIIPGADKPYGGWPVSPNIVCIHRGLDLKGDYALTHTTWITAHEIGHQYWGFNYVLEPSNYPQWFGISMGIYTDWLYSKSRNIEKDYYSFFRSYIDGFSKGYNTTVMQFTDSLNNQGFDWNNVIKHGKSFAILRMLAYEIGEEKFFKVFDHCLKSYKGVNVTLDMFQSDCESISNMDLDWFFNQWFLTNKCLDYTVNGINSTKNEGSYITSFDIRRNGGAIATTIDFQVITANGESLYKAFNGRLPLTEKNIETEDPIIEIIIDPEKEYPLMSERKWTITNKRQQ